MGGLEVSEVMLSQTVFENSVKRIDAEYFKKQYLKEDSLRINFPTKYLSEISFITDGQHGYHQVDEQSEIRHLTAKNFKDWFANDNGADRLAKWVDDNNKRSSLKVNDIVLTTRGSVGFCAIVKDNVLPANIDQDVARIVLDDESQVLPQYLLAYINSKFGQDWTKRNQTGMVQQGLALWRIKEFPIPEVSRNFQENIKTIIELSFKKIRQSEEYYSQSETILLESIRLNGLELSSDPVNIKSFKDSFLKTGRLDAEYYQKKYDDYRQLILAYSNGYEKLSSICHLQDSNVEPIDNIEYQYIELSNIGNAGNITDCTKAIGKDLPSRARRRVQTNDVIISSIEGSLQSCAVVTSNYNNSLCSTGFYIINSKKINPATLLILFKSAILQNLLKQICSGTILTAINKQEFLNIPIPVIEIAVQRQIASFLDESFKLKRQSDELLEIAKKAVETAIEKGETEAIKFIQTLIHANLEPIDDNKEIRKCRCLVLSVY